MKRCRTGVGGEIGPLVALLPDVRKESDKSDPDTFIARLAASQHGIVTTAQLRASGISFPGINRRVQTARLHRLHRGVYAVGHRRLSKEGRWMAAVLACGPGAVLSHLSAAELWRIRRRAGRASVDHGESVASHVTVPTTSGKAARRDRASPFRHPD
jgi:hypothetical protein